MPAAARPRNFWAAPAGAHASSSGFMEFWVRSDVGALERDRSSDRTPRARQRCAALPSRAQGRGRQALLTIGHATCFYRPRSPSPARVPSAAARDRRVPCPGRVRVRVRVREGAMSWSALLRRARLARWPPTAREASTASIGARSGEVSCLACSCSQRRAPKKGCALSGEHGAVSGGGGGGGAGGGGGGGGEWWEVSTLISGTSCLRPPSLCLGLGLGLGLGC